MPGRDQGKIEGVLDRLAAKGLVLPAAPSAVANYEPFSIIGDLIVTSGQLPFVDGALAYRGMIGESVTPEDGYRACAAATLNGIAQINAAVGSMDNVRIVRIEGVLRMRDSRLAPQTLNGASDLVNSVFLERGRHSRMIHLAENTPLDAPCLIVLWAERLR